MNADHVLNWRISVADIPARGLRETRVAAVEERAAIVRALGLLSCDKVELRFNLKANGSISYRLEGTLEASVTQACVVTLEPVPARLYVPILIDFHPNLPVLEVADLDLGDPYAQEEHETIENGTLLLGRFVFEELVSTLDPYPRSAGVEFDWKDPTEGTSSSASAFAKLAILKEKPDKC